MVNLDLGGQSTPVRVTYYPHPSDRTHRSLEWYGVLAGAEGACHLPPACLPWTGEVWFPATHDEESKGWAELVARSPKIEVSRSNVWEYPDVGLVYVGWLVDGSVKPGPATVTFPDPKLAKKSGLLVPVDGRPGFHQFKQA